MPERARARRLSSWAYSASAERATASRTPPVRRYPSTVRVGPSRRCQVCRRTCDSSGRAPGSSSASRSSSSTRPLSSRSPAWRAGFSITSRRPVRLIGASRCRPSSTTRANSGSAATRSVRRSARSATTSSPSYDARARRNSSARSASWQTVTASSHWSTTSTGKRPWRGSRRPAPSHGLGSGRDHHDLAARRAPARGTSPARTSEDFPVPEGPTTTSTPAAHGPPRQAPTSASRPKNDSLSSAS